jgi:hypothetical protein
MASFDPPALTSKFTEWVTKQRRRHEEGLALLLKHYGIEEGPGEYKELALALAIDHVPYCMEPTLRRGRPATTREWLAKIDGIIADRKSKGVSEKRSVDGIARIFRIDRDSLTRQLRRYRADKKQK